MKDLVIGVFSNYGYDDVKPWVKSIKETEFDGDVVLIGLDTKPGTMERISADGALTISAVKQKNSMIHMERFIHIYNYLKTNEGKYRNVVSTDVRDVVFQEDPSKYMFGNSGIISSGEAIKIKDEEWNRNNIIKNFGEYFYEEIKDNVVQNVGILAGEAGYVKELCFYLYQMSMGRPDWVADQAAYNIIVNRPPWREITTFTHLINGWAINAHVTNFEPTKKQFEKFLLEPRPELKDGKIINSQGFPFIIVHQYDRVVEWKKFYEDKYGVKIKSQYTPEVDDYEIVIRTT